MLLKRIKPIRTLIVSFIIFRLSYFFLFLYSFPCGCEACYKLFPNKISLFTAWFGQFQEDFRMIPGYEYHNHLLVYDPQMFISIILYNIIICLAIGILATALFTHSITPTKKVKRAKSNSR